MPMNIVIDSTAIATSVGGGVPALRRPECRHAVRDRLDPVIAVQPFEKAVRIANVVSALDGRPAAPLGPTGDGLQRTGQRSAMRRRRSSRVC